MKFSIENKFRFILLFMVFGAVVHLLVVYRYQKLQEFDTIIVNTAAAQRSLCQSMATNVYSISSGQDQNRESLQILISSYENALKALHEGGQYQGIEMPKAPTILKSSFRQNSLIWSRVKGNMDVILSEQQENKEFATALAFLKDNSMQLLTKVDELVKAYARLENAADYQLEKGIAGRQRIFSENIMKNVFAVASGNDEERAALLKMIDIYANSLLAIRYGGESKSGSATAIKAAPPAVLAYLDDLQAAWEAFKEQALIVQREERLNPKFRKAIEQIDNDHDLLLQSTDQITRDFTQYFSKRSSTLRLLTSFMVVFNLLMFALGCFVARRIVRPLKKLAQTALVIGQGNFEVQVEDPQTKDEVKDLSLSFQNMVENLKKTTVSKDYFGNILSSMMDSLAVIGLDGKIEKVNAAMCELVEYDEKQLIGQHIELVISEKEEFRKNILPPIMSGDVLNQSVEMGFRTRQEVFVPMLISLAALKNREGELEGCVIIAKNITEMKIYEMSLNKEKEKAERASIAKSQFLANMSHEIRTPLNSVLGFAELLGAMELEQVARRYIDIISENGKHLLSLINDILDISKIEADEILLEEIDFNLDTMMESIVKVSQVRVKDKDVELHYYAEKRVPRNLRGDPTRLKQVLMNLVGNAAKFTKEGEISLSVRFLEEVEREDGNTYNELRFSVRDTGIGIPEEKLGNIFEDFTQADMSTTREYGGTGLGLSICKRLVGLMGGDIAVRSTVGEGSEFYFTAYIKPGKAIKETDVSLLDPGELKGKKVFVVDDNEKARFIMRKYAEEIGLEVLGEKDNIDDAMDWLEEVYELPDMIFSDIMMPGGSGYEFAQRVKDHPEFASIKILAVTSEAVPGAAQKAQSCGFDGYLTKPIIKKDFIKVIRATLGDEREHTEGEIVTKHMSEDVSLKGLNVLVVEDHPHNQELFSTYLNSLGCNVQIADNGKIAVDLVQRNEYDICFMDMQMPVMGGVEATKIIRQELRLTELPIVALTANALKEDKDRGLSAGMNDFVTKPINFALVRDVIAKYTGRN